MGPFVTPMRVAGNYLKDQVGVVVGRSLTALTALQTLDLSCKELYLVVLSGVSFEVCYGGCGEGRLRVGPVVSLMRVIGNRFSRSICCKLASSVMHFARLPSLLLDDNPDSCIKFGDWQRLGWPLPPQHMCRTWTQALFYVRWILAFCTLVCSSRSHLASCVRVAAAAPPLLLYAAPAPAAVYLPMLKHAQLQLLLCGAGHACHFVRVMMPRDVRYNRDPRKQLLLRLFTEAAVQRLSGLGPWREFFAEEEEEEEEAVLGARFEGF